MTGFMSDKFRWNCDDRGCYNKTLPRWDSINECFPGNIRPTDLDGVVERNGHVLFIEGKSLGTSIPTGQRLLFKALSSKPDQMVVVLRPGVRTELQMLVFRHGESRDGFQDITKSDLHGFLNNWFDIAERQRSAAS